MYLSSDIRDASGPINTGMNRGGWVHLQYGESGNVEVMTVRGECYDTASNACWDDTSLDEGARATHLVNNCDCARAHHYAYRWDELNRLAEARRYEWSSAGSQWDLMVRQRYRYDGANQRTVKETRDGTFAGDATGGVDRAALYVYPGDFERRGVSTDLMNAEWSPASTGNTESQYMVAGARVVWKDETHGMSGFEPDIRVTYALPNLIQSTTGVVDLISGELLERTTFYPNGARETLRTNTASAGAWGTEPLGFTGKEGDDEVGLTYFGERYLLQHLGRWASPDPLQVHAGGGGEFGNSYHYVGGNLLQAGIHSGWGQQDWSSQGRGGDRSSPPRPVPPVVTPPQPTPPIAPPPQTPVTPFRPPVAPGVAAIGVAVVAFVAILLYSSDTNPQDGHASHTRCVEANGVDACTAAIKAGSSRDKQRERREQARRRQRERERRREERRERVEEGAPPEEAEPEQRDAPMPTHERNDIEGAVQRDIDAEEFQRDSRRRDAPDEMEGRGRARTTAMTRLREIGTQEEADRAFGVETDVEPATDTEAPGEEE